MSALNGLALVDLAGSVLVQLMYAATALLLPCCVLAVTIGRRSAAVKHRIWSLGIVGLLLFLVVAPLLPRLGGNWWSRWSTARSPQASLIANALAPSHAITQRNLAQPSTASDRPSVDEGRFSYPPGTEPTAFESSNATVAKATTDTTKTSAPAAANNLDLSPWLRRSWAIVWLTGVVCGMIRWLANHVTACQLVRRAAEVKDIEVLGIRDDVAVGLGLGRSLPIRCSPEVIVPLATGALFPCVLLPPGCGRWDLGRLRMTLAHELAHIARRDVLWQSLAQLTCCVYWPHPLVWLAAWRMRVEREYASDDAVLAIGAGPTDYATHLVELASVLRKSTRPVPAAVAIATRSEVETRVRSILRTDTLRGPVGKRLGVCLAAITTAVMIVAGVFRPSLANDSDGATKEKTAAAQSSDKANSTPAKAANGKSDTKKVDKNAISGPPVPQSELRGVVVDEAGRPVADVTVFADYHTGPGSAVTDATGMFSISVPTATLPGLHLLTGVDKAHRIAHSQLPYQKVDPAEQLKLQLKPAQRAQLRVTDAKGKPVAGAKARMLLDHSLRLRQDTDSQGVAEFWLPGDSTVHTVHVWKVGQGLDYRSYFNPRTAMNKQPQKTFDFTQPLAMTLSGIKQVRVTLLDAETGTPISGTTVYPWLLNKPGESTELNLSYFADEFTATTDAAGDAYFDWLPNWVPDDYLFQFWHNNEDYVRQRGNYRIADGGGGLKMRLQKLVPIRGQVRLPDGQPAAEIRLAVNGASYGHDDFRRTVTTDKSGRYEIKAAPDQIYLVVVDDQKWAAEPGTGFVLKSGQPKEDLDFELRPATRLFGRVTQGPNHDPVSGHQMYVYQYGKDLHNTPGLSLPNPEDSRRWVQPLFVRYVATDKDGRYEFHVGPGNYDIRGPSQLKIEKFDVQHEPTREFNFDSPRAERGRLQGLVVSGDPKHSAGKARIAGVYRHELAGLDLDLTADEKGKFDIERELHRVVLHAVSADKMLARIVEIAPDDETVNLTLKPIVKLTGRLVDSTTKQALANREIQYGVDVHLGEDNNSPFRTSFGGQVKSDADGKFRMDNLVVEQTYRLSLVRDRDANGQARGWSNAATVTTRDGETSIDLGDVEIKQDPNQPK